MFFFAFISIAYVPLCRRSEVSNYISSNQVISGSNDGGGGGIMPSSPGLKFVREDSVEGTLSPVSPKLSTNGDRAGTDTDTEKKKVRLWFPK